MRIGLIIIIVTVFLVVNTYYDGKYTKIFHIDKNIWCFHNKIIIPIHNSNMIF